MSFAICINSVYFSNADKKEKLNTDKDLINILSQAKKSIRIITKSTDGKYFIIISCVFTFGIQVICHFWQPIMLSGKNIGGLSNEELYTLMFCHIGAFSSQYLSNYILPKFDIHSKTYVFLAMFFSFGSAFLCILLMLLITNSLQLLSIFIFSAIHGWISAIPVGAQNIFVSRLEKQDDKYISGALGLVSFSCRIASIIILCGINLLPSGIPVVQYIIISSVAYMFCGFSFFKWSRRFMEINYKSQIE